MKQAFSLMGFELKEHYEKDYYVKQGVLCPYCNSTEGYGITVFSYQQVPKTFENTIKKWVFCLKCAKPIPPEMLKLESI